MKKKKTNNIPQEEKNPNNTKSAYSKSFKSELDNRYEEYINGGILISEHDVNKQIRRIITDYNT